MKVDKHTIEKIHEAMRNLERLKFYDITVTMENSRVYELSASMLSKLDEVPNRLRNACGRIFENVRKGKLPLFEVLEISMEVGEALKAKRSRPKEEVRDLADVMDKIEKIRIPTIRIVFKLKGIKWAEF